MSLDRLGRRRRAAAGVHRRGRRVARRPPDVPPPALLHRPPVPRRRRRAAPRPGLARPRRPGDERTTTGATTSAGRSAMFVNGDGIPARTPAASDHRRLLPALLQRPRRPLDFTLPAERVRPGVGRGDQHRRRPDAEADGRGGRPSACHPQPVVLREHSEPRPARPSVAASLAAARRTTVTDARPPHPHSTYRVQVRPGFDLDATAGSLDYLPTSASTGSTARRCWPPRPAARTATTWSTTGRVNPELGGEEGRQRCGRGARGWAWAWSSTSCPTTSGSPRRRRTRPGGTCCRPRARVRRLVRHRLGPRAGSLLPVLADDPTPGRPHGRRRRAALPRAPLPDRRRHRRRHPARGARPAALRAGLLARGDAELTYRRFFAVTDLAGCGWRTRRSSPPPTRRSCAGSPTARSTASGSTTPTGCATPRGYLARLRAAAPRRLSLVEKILEYGEELPGLAGGRHHRLRRARRGRRALRRPGRRGRLHRAGHPPPRHARRWQDLIHDTKLAAADGCCRRGWPELAALAPRAADEEARPTLAELVAASRSTGATRPQGRGTWRRPSPRPRRRPDLAATSGRAHRRLRRPRTSWPCASSSSPAR